MDAQHEQEPAHQCGRAAGHEPDEAGTRPEDERESPLTQFVLQGVDARLGGGMTGHGFIIAVETASIQHWHQQR